MESWSFLKKAWTFIKDLWHLNWEIKFVKKRPKIVFVSSDGAKINIKEEVSIKLIGNPIYPNTKNSRGYKVQPHNRITIPPECIGAIKTKDNYVMGPFQKVQVGNSSTISLLVKGVEGGDVE